MLIQCWRGYKGVMEDDRCFQMTQRLGGFAKIRIDHIDFFVPEDRAEFLILLEPRLIRLPDQDYID